MKNRPYQNFKKVHDAEDHAIFRRDDGHEIKISKASLRPAMKKQLDLIPIHAADGAVIPEQAPAQQPQINIDPAEVQRMGLYAGPYAPPVESSPKVTAGAEMQASQQQQPQSPQLAPMYGMENINKVFGGQEQALKEGYAGMTGAIGEAQKAQSEYAKAIQDQLKATQDRQNAIRGDLDKDREAYIKQNIDPNRVWSNKTTGQKVATLIGLFLGGLGQGMVGGDNPAATMLKNQIDRDIDAQKNTLGKQHTLYSMNLHKLQNEQAADAATRLQMLNAVQAKLSLSGMKMQGAQAKQALTMGLAGIEKDKLPYIQQLAQFGLMNQAQQRGIPSGTSAEMLLPEKFQERLVNVKGPDGKMIKVPAQTKEDAEKYKQSSNMLDGVEHAVKDLQKLNEDGLLGRHVWGTETRDRIAAAAGSIKTQLAALHGLNRMTDIEMHEFSKMVPDEGTWNTDKGKKMLQDIIGKIQAKRDSDGKNFLSNFSPATDINFTPRQ